LTPSTAIEARLADVRGRVAAACTAAGRPAASVEIVAVSKYASLEETTSLAAAGQRAFGESRMQDAVRKIEVMGRGPSGVVAWHMVGHLQTNKVRQAVEHFDVVQSVDSRHLGDALSRRAVHKDAPLPILLEVNTARDLAKHGFMPEDLRSDFPALAELAGLRICGLMTVATQVPRAGDAAPFFASLRELRDELDAMGVAPPMPELSMGMSADFEVAIAEGSTMVRLGSVLFGGGAGG
jgi:pyridoxal phosphate enzyme (YggS family)